MMLIKKDKTEPTAVKPKSAPPQAQADVFKQKLAGLEQRLEKINAEIGERQKKGEDLGVLLMQRRSLASWRSRFQKRLKAS